MKQKNVRDIEEFELNESRVSTVYARSEQCDLGPIYTITNTQCIRIYPGKLKFILVKISLDPRHLHREHTKGSQTLFTFLAAANLSRLSCSHECKYGA